MSRFRSRRDNSASQLVRTILIAVAIIASIALTLLMPPEAGAQPVITESFATQAEFQASALYTYIQALPGGIAIHVPVAIQQIRQGSVEVPPSSAGAISNSTVTAEITSALISVPVVLSGSSDEADYLKMFVTLGNETGAGSNPEICFELPEINTGATGGYNGYDIVIFDIGKDLVSDVGEKNRERTDFSIELISEGVPYPVGTLTNSGGDYINALLLDVSAFPGVPPTIDALRIVDATGSTNPRKESLDIDGVLRLNHDGITQTLSASWGRLKAIHR